MSDLRIVPAEPTEKMRHAIGLGVYRDLDTHEFYAAILAAAPSPWQSIEIAPRNMIILGWQSGWRRFREVHWHRDHWECAFAGSMAVYPTHWMPLPPPPEEG